MHVFKPSTNDAYIRPIGAVIHGLHSNKPMYVSTLRFTCFAYPGAATAVCDAQQNSGDRPGNMGRPVNGLLPEQVLVVCTSEHHFQHP